MRRKNYKGRRIKRNLKKCSVVFRAYDKVQNALGDLLDNDPDIVEIRCNVVFETDELKDYTSDFVCTKSDGTILVRECCYRTILLRERTINLLDASQRYWLQRGITDWKVVIDREEESNHKNG